MYKSLIINIQVFITGLNWSFSNGWVWLFDLCD